MVGGLEAACVGPAAGCWPAAGCGLEGEALGRPRASTAGLAWGDVGSSGLCTGLGVVDETDAAVGSGLAVTGEVLVPLGLTGSAEVLTPLGLTVTGEVLTPVDPSVTADGLKLPGAVGELVSGTTTGLETTTGPGMTTAGLEMLCTLLTVGSMDAGGGEAAWGNDHTTFTLCGHVSWMPKPAHAALRLSEGIWLCISQVTALCISTGHKSICRHDQLHGTWHSHQGPILGEVQAA